MSCLNPSAFTSIWIAAEPADFRRSVDGLVSIIKSSGHTPDDGSLYIFSNKARNRLKMVWFDGCSAWLIYRRLHNGKFHWNISKDGMVHLDQKQLEYLLEGLSVDQRTMERKIIKYY